MSYHIAKKLQIGITVDRWMIFDGQRWTEVDSVKTLKAWMLVNYLKKFDKKLSEINHWSNFKPDEPTSKKSYRWTRQSPTNLTPSLPKQVLITGYQALLGVLPVKWNKIKNRERNDTNCVMCNEKIETTKHLFCSCKDPEIHNLKTARHNKTVSELELWGKIAVEK